MKKRLRKNIVKQIYMGRNMSKFQFWKRRRAQAAMKILTHPSKSTRLLMEAGERKLYPPIIIHAPYDSENAFDFALRVVHEMEDDWLRRAKELGLA